MAVQSGAMAAKQGTSPKITARPREAKIGGGAGFMLPKEDDWLKHTVEG